MPWHRTGNQGEGNRLMPTRETIETILRKRLGPNLSVKGITPVSGGDMNDAFRVETTKSVWFLKMHAHAPYGFFDAEWDGLEALRTAASLLRIPHVQKAEERDGEWPAWLLMEWIHPGEPGPRTAEVLGQGLAELHRFTASAFGWQADNFIGILLQPNTRTDHWPSFWRDQRLLPQFRLAEKRNRLPSERYRRLERLMDRLDHWLDTSDAVPSLLHGDLWGGNWLVDTDGRPCLIDPAAYHGHREVDLAMTELFGGFPKTFHHAYREAYPVDPGYEERRPLYQLYYLLVHLNLFGEGYGESVDRILRRYAG
ncbi:fructosamine kinase family protein [Desmospora profundinema]|uniref:Fructosamine-3-kinase n=1 Tax=Desmospora profundinema TaxID=1571184 RepID=A0ABU1INN5_9BACL|nr:fructosamine kinase family protein [Desmospora profundinema]MDR6226395.1 fructosamine-3-kinase [Desmospora profundinema]